MPLFNYNTSQGVVQGASAIGQGIGQGIQDARAEALANAPIPKAWAAFIQRLMKGEDPVRLGREAAAHPEIQEMKNIMAGLHQQKGFDRGSVPDVGAPGGRPQVMPPGAVNPAGAGGPRSLGDIQQGQHVGAAQAVGGYQPQSLAAPTPFTGTATQGKLQGVEGVPGSYNMAQMGQPAQGAPQVSPQQAGAQVLPPSQPRPAAPPQAQPKRLTNREFSQLAPLIPTAIAAQGRGQVAQQNADSRVQVANLRATQAILLGVMKENGLADRFGELMQSVAEKYDVSQQQAVLRSLTDMFRAQTGADATRDAAGIKADVTRETKNPLEKELSDIQRALSVVVASPEYRQSPQAQAEYRRLLARRGELERELGREGGSTPYPIVGPTPPGGGDFGNPGKKDKPFATKPDSKTSASFRIRYKKNHPTYAGRTGMATDQTFNPQTMEKISK